MKKEILLTLITIFLYSLTQAQVPGYRGKHFSTFYQLSLSPGLNTSFKKANPGIYLNHRHALDLDYVISKTTSLGLSGQFFRTGEEVFEPSLASLNHMQLQTFAAGGYAKFYPFLKRGVMAPLGPYYKLQYLFLVNDLEPSEALPIGEESRYPGRYMTSALVFSIGHNILIKDFLFLNYGIQTGLISGWLIHGSENRFYEVNTRLQKLFALNVNVGVGVLVF